VVDEFEAVPRGDLALALLDAGIGEFLHPAAVLADDVVVVLALVELEYGRSTLEVVTGDEARRLELRQHSIDRREADVLV